MRHPIASTLIAALLVLVLSNADAAPVPLAERSGTERGAERVERLLTWLTSQKKYNLYVTRVRTVPGFYEYLRSNLLGYKLTLFVADDSAWFFPSNLPGPTQFKYLQYNTFYDAITAAKLTNLLPGEMLLNLNRDLAFKTSGNAFAPKKTAHSGVKLVQGNAYYDSSGPGLPLIVHLVDGLLPPGPSTS